MPEILSPAETDALRLSLEIASRSVLWSLPVAVLAAWVLTRVRFPGRTLLDAFVHLPLVLPPVAVGYVLLLVFGMNGTVGRWLYQVFGVQLAFTKSGAALATAVMTFPLMVRAIRIALEGVDRGLEAAARTLGAGALDRFATITLPLMLPGILGGARYSVLGRAWGVRRGDYVRFQYSGRNSHLAARSVHGNSIA